MLYFLVAIFVALLVICRDPAVTEKCITGFSISRCRNVLRMSFLIDLIDCSDWIFDRINPIVDMQSLQYPIFKSVSDMVRFSGVIVGLGV